jgi:hypothetical protein
VSTSLPVWPAGSMLTPTPRLNQAASSDNLSGFRRSRGVTPHSTIRDSAAAVGEDARRQTLDELYRWRALLNALLNAQLAASMRVKNEREA